MMTIRHREAGTPSPYGPHVRAALAGPEHGHRLALGGIIAAASPLGASPSAFPQAEKKASTPPVFAKHFAYVGCRTTKERKARGQGIRVFKIDAEAGTWTPIQLVGNLINPSFLAFDRDERHLYAVHGDMSEVSAFRIDPESGELTYLNTQSTQGRNPAHLVVDESDRFLIVANYATGTLAVLPRRDDGSLDPVKQLVSMPGTPGPHKVDQTFSHPHEIAYDRGRRFLIVPDKGLDRVFTFRFDAARGELISGNPASVDVRPGAGPRHVVFHPNAPYAYVAHELDSSVGTYRYDADSGALTPLQIVPSVPDTFVGANTAAEIEITPSGRFVFISNRGADSIGAYAVETSTGMLTPVGWTSSGGIGPRFIALDPSGSVIYAANEHSDTIVPFHVDETTGLLRGSGEPIQTGSPVCIVFTTHRTKEND